MDCKAEQRWKREAMPMFSRQEEKRIIELALQSCRTEQFDLLLYPSFRPISIRLFSLHPNFPGSSQRRKVLTRIHPLHSIRKGIIRNQIVSPPPGIREHRVRSHALQPSSQPHGDNSNG
jgi:hypothetical protein